MKLEVNLSAVVDHGRDPELNALKWATAHWFICLGITDCLLICKNVALVLRPMRMAPPIIRAALELGKTKNT